ncbi:MAG: PssD/Cps14F family polysaccharide biosynthesis glycosyltransferase [Sandaracinaceae bacterium]|nr:UDP-N-acetylglucosamine--LPS N-acetylglucosamine transferase [Myxococcales bacterium]
MRREASRKKIVAISSGGGHWIELLRLRPAFDGHFVVWVTVSEAYRAHVDGPLRVIDDVTRWDRLGLLKCAWQVTRILLSERPDVVVSTGALPGFFGVVLAKRLGIRTVWVDSLANVEELSMSGQKVGAHADLWLTQWPELAREGGPLYAGSVLGELDRPSEPAIMAEAE